MENGTKHAEDDLILKKIVMVKVGNAVYDFEKSDPDKTAKKILIPQKHYKKLKSLNLLPLQYKGIPIETEERCTEFKAI